MNIAKQLGYNEAAWALLSPMIDRAEEYLTSLGIPDSETIGMTVEEVITLAVTKAAENLHTP